MRSFKALDNRKQSNAIREYAASRHAAPQKAASFIAQPAIAQELRAATEPNDRRLNARRNLPRHLPAALESPAIHDERPITDRVQRAPLLP
jgi:hypothetical protein